MCLRSGHRIYDCRIRRNCGVENCGAGHHRLHHGVIHLPTESKKRAVRANCGSTNTAQRGVILGMIPVRVVGPTEDVLTYAFLDSGSDTTLVSQELINRLNLTGKPSEIRVTTIAGSQVIPGRTVALEIRSLDGENEFAVERAHSVPSLRMKPPVDAIRNEISKWPHLEGVPFGEIPDKRVSILIGNDVPEAHWVFDQRLGGRKQPYAVKTLLGWMLLGPLGSHEGGLSAVNCLQRADASIAEQIKKIYSAEFADTEKFTCPRSMEDDNAVRVVRNTTQLTNGHYVVPLPWRHPEMRMPNNRTVAEKRLEYLKRRFIRDRNYCLQYTEAIEKNLGKGFAIRVPPSSCHQTSHPDGTYLTMEW
ncbi:Zinc knuckle [Paragonimus westermani]|uniref:Zinc knuckle n=1 Tax=Paragonimus westermani TaxID=34504 RepID=A0A8T0D9L5_9TREM|nr:Zinc knuckle [Paragonimus westermani]